MIDVKISSMLICPHWVLSAYKIPFTGCAHCTLETKEHHARYFLIFDLFSDIEECKAGTDGCHDNATCTDGNGSYTCECKDGFTGDGFTCTGIIFLILNLKQTILHRFHEEKIERVHIVTIWQGSFQSISFTPHTLKFGQIYPF